MKKLFLVLLALLFFTSCNSNEEVYKPIENSTTNVDLVTQYNFYTKGYNEITKTMDMVISQYANLLTLDNTPLYNGNASLIMELSFDDFNYMKKQIFAFPNDMEKNTELHRDYVNLLSTLKPLYESYNQTFAYYQKYSDDNIVLYNQLHTDFILSYSSFKNTYLDFHEKLIELYDIYKFEYIISLEENNLFIHSHLSKIIMFTDEIIEILDDSKNYKFEKNLKNQLDAINKEISMLNKLSSSDIKDYFNNDLLVAEFDLLMDKINQLKEVNLKLSNKKTNQESFKYHYIDLKQSITEGYNQLIIL